MENHQMNRSCGRPYQTTCGMTKAPTSAPSCACRLSHTPTKNAEMYSHVDHMEPGMAYVPCQQLTKTYDLCYALHVGTIFPQLCKPFCGKRGRQR